MKINVKEKNGTCVIRLEMLDSLLVFFYFSYPAAYFYAEGNTQTYTYYTNIYFYKQRESGVV